MTRTRRWGRTTRLGSQSLEDRQRARPSTEFGTWLQDFVESEDGQRLTRLLQDSAAGQALSAQLEQDLDTAYQEVAKLMASGDFPIAPPWAVRLVTMQCTTEHVLDLFNDNAGAENSFVERLQDKLHEDDVRLVATEIDRWLASHDEPPLDGDGADGFAVSHGLQGRPR